MPVNWGLAGGNNALAMFQQGAQLGGQLRERREQADYRNAMLQQRQQETAARAAEQQAAAAEKAQGRQRNDLVVMGKLLDHAKDEGSYQQGLAAARQYGIDTQAAPPNFDPNWVAQQRMIVAAIAKDGGQRLSAEALRLKEAGYSDDEIQMKMREFVNRPDYMAVPPGGTLVNTRDPSAIGAFGASQGGPQPGAIEDGYRFKGGNPADPNAWEPVQGGPQVAPAATFPG